MKHLIAVKEPDVVCFRADDLSQSSRERERGGRGEELRRINVSIIFVWPFPYLACKNLLPLALYCSSSAQQVGHPILDEGRGALQLSGDASENK